MWRSKLWRHLRSSFTIVTYDRNSFIIQPTAFLFQGPSNYAFGYAVRDDYSGDDFSHNEVRDGYKTTGEYRVSLPDGRTQGQMS